MRGAVIHFRSHAPSLLTPSLLGHDFLEAHRACIDYSLNAGDDSRLSLIVGGSRVDARVSTRPRPTAPFLAAAVDVAAHSS